MQIIVFEVNQEHFGFDLTLIREINRKMVITPVPNSPEYFLGVTNLRGKIVPVIHLGTRLGLGNVPLEGETQRILVLEMEGEMIGFEVNRVLEVRRLEKDQIMEFSDSGNIPHREAVLGVVKNEGQMMTLLDLRKLI